MRIIPVLDLMNGVVVRGVAGRRSAYRPLVSRMTPSVFPVTVAEDLRTHFGFTTFYLADLDAIAGGPLPRDTVSTLHERGFHIWLDAGIVFDHHAAAVAQLGVARVVVGLETVASPNEVERITKALGEGVVFSLDLRAGEPMGHIERWRSTDAFDIVAQAIELGVRRVLILDLARVGVGEGTGTDSLCTRVAATFPHVEVSAGGGVRGGEDLRRLHESGVQNVLIASALHDGRIRPEEVRGCRW